MTKHYGKGQAIQHRLAPLLLLLIGLELSRRGIASLLRGGDFIVLGAPLLGIGVAAAGTGLSSILLTAWGRRCVARWMCLVAAVPCFAAAVSIFRSPDHGEIGGLLIFPLSGAGILLLFIAVYLDATRRFRCVLVGAWLGAVALSVFVPLGEMESGLHLLRDGGPALWLLFSMGAISPFNVMLIVEGALHGQEKLVADALLLAGSIIAGGLLGARIERVTRGPGRHRHDGTE